MKYLFIIIITIYLILSFQLLFASDSNEQYPEYIPPEKNMELGLITGYDLNYYSVKVESNTNDLILHNSSINAKSYINSIPLGFTILRKFFPNIKIGGEFIFHLFDYRSIYINDDFIETQKDRSYWIHFNGICIYNLNNFNNALDNVQLGAGLGFLLLSGKNVSELDPILFIQAGYEFIIVEKKYSLVPELRWSLNLMPSYGGDFENEEANRLSESNQPQNVSFSYFHHFISFRLRGSYYF